MARRKTTTESTRSTKLALAERLAALRSELFGERGGPEMARRLGVPARTWYNYEGGVSLPTDVMLKVIELTSVEPTWLLHGRGPKFKRTRSESTEPTAVAEILSRANSIEGPEEFEELTAGLLALRARRLAPVVSDEETRLLLAVNDGVSVESKDRAASLIEKRDNGSLTVEETSELLRLAEEVERQGMERLEALSTLAELRGVSLRELMQSLGVAARDHG
jgi:transcriptional regulator with XRE-family HTH domain